MYHQYITWACNTHILARKYGKGQTHIAVLPSDRRSSLFSHHIFLPSLYLLCCVYLTHSSRRGSKLALNNNQNDNYSQGTTQKTEWDKMGHWPFFIFLFSIHRVTVSTQTAPTTSVELSYIWLMQTFKSSGHCSASTITKSTVLKVWFVCWFVSIPCIYTKFQYFWIRAMFLQTYCW